MNSLLVTIGTAAATDTACVPIHTLLDRLFDAVLAVVDDHHDDEDDVVAVVLLVLLVLLVLPVLLSVSSSL